MTSTYIRWCLPKMLYIFAGYPKNGFNAGGLRYCIEEVEHLAELEHDPAIQYRKEGVFAGESDEELYPLEVVLSTSLELDGITWDWFPEKFSFGNGITVAKTSASPDYKTVVRGTDLNLDEFLSKYGTTPLAQLELERRHIRYEGWEKYEARWLPNTCPQEPHEVFLTFIITTHKLPDFIYDRIKDLIEGGAEPKNKRRYKKNRDSYFSDTRPFTKELICKGGSTC